MEIYQILKEREARGLYKAVPIKELADLLHTNARQVKRWVEIERRRHFICSTTANGGGYYRPKDEAEIRTYIDRQEKLIQAHAKTLRLARRFAKRRRERKQSNEERII